MLFLYSVHTIILGINLVYFLEFSGKQRLSRFERLRHSELGGDFFRTGGNIEDLGYGLGIGL